MFYGNTHENWKNTKLLVCNYDLFSQIIHLKKTMSKRTFLCFSTAFICNMGKECKLVWLKFLSKTATYNLHCCRWHKIYYKIIFVQYIIFLHSKQWHGTQQHTENALLWFHCKPVMRKRYSVVLRVHCLSCWYVVINYLLSKMDICNSVRTFSLYINNYKYGDDANIWSCDRQIKLVQEQYFGKPLFRNVK